jgi:hypothetical protein
VFVLSTSDILCLYVSSFSSSLPPVVSARFVTYSIPTGLFINSTIVFGAVFQKFQPDVHSTGIITSVQPVSFVAGGVCVCIELPTVSIYDGQIVACSNTKSVQLYIYTLYQIEFGTDAQVKDITFVVNQLEIVTDNSDEASVSTLSQAIAVILYL